jgi:hypothetical protein
MESIGEILIMYGNATKDLENKYELYISKIKVLKEYKAKGKNLEDVNMKIEKYKLKALETKTKISNILKNINENLEQTLNPKSKDKKPKDLKTKEEKKADNSIKSSLYKSEESSEHEFLPESSEYESSGSDSSSDSSESSSSSESNSDSDSDSSDSESSN